MSLVCADMARFKMETEEDGVETEYTPEWARVTLTGVDVIEEEWKGTLHGIRGVSDSAVHIKSVRNWSTMETEWTQTDSLLKTSHHFIT